MMKKNFIYIKTDSTNNKTHSKNVYGGLPDYYDDLGEKN